MLLVYGPRSATYDFGPGHPLTPRRFGPGIDLLRAVGAEPGLAPEAAPDEDLAWCHDARFIKTVRAFGRDPFGMPAAGISEGGDVPPFADMHEAGAMVAGGSLRALEAILRGDVEHAFHPGGGLHHAMRDRAAGFCIYNDPALVIARARRDGLRVLYVDLDVHHGDGVQALHWDDPGVLTISFHETGRYLFPGTGFADEIGEGSAAGTSVNVPLEPGSGEEVWLAAVRRLVPALAASFGPDLVVSQHGADSHAWDPLAHLRVTTTAMGEAARVVDTVAHRWAGGRWLATGGGGYDAYRVVPRAWALTWLAGAHREVPSETPEAWRERWAAEAARYGQGPLPPTFKDEPNAGVAVDASQEAAEHRSREVARAVTETLVPALVQAALDRGSWSWQAGSAAPESAPGDVAGGEPRIVAGLDAAAWEGLTVGDGVFATARPGDAQGMVRALLASAQAGTRVTAAVVGSMVVGACLSTGPIGGGHARQVIALGVAHAHRGHGLAGKLVATHIEAVRDLGAPIRAVITVAERDVIQPLPRALRAEIARRLLKRAGFTVRPALATLRAVDPLALEATLSP